jgi:hypothetical protein
VRKCLPSRLMAGKIGSLIRLSIQFILLERVR